MVIRKIERDMQGQFVDLGDGKQTPFEEYEYNLKFVDFKQY